MCESLSVSLSFPSPKRVQVRIAEFFCASWPEGDGKEAGLTYSYIPMLMLKKSWICYRERTD